MEVAPLLRKRKRVRKRKGYWKAYEQADIKNYRRVWNIAREIVQEEGVIFDVSGRGRPPKLEHWMYVCIAILYVYFDDPFRETEQLLYLLTGKKLDHSNIVRWFGKLNPKYVDKITYRVHQRVIQHNHQGDYVADSSGITCDRYKEKIVAGERIRELRTWKLHIFAQYLYVLGLVSILSVWATNGNAGDSPAFHNHLIKSRRVIKGRKCHADKAYFSKRNIRKLKQAGLIPNLVPPKRNYTDALLKRAIQKYDNEARKKNRGLVETPFGGLTTQMHMKTRCRKTKHKHIFTTLLGLKHNIKTLLRAQALKITTYFRTNL